MEPLCLYCNLPEPKHLGPRQWCPKGQANIENRALKAFLPAHNLRLVSLLDVLSKIGQPEGPKAV